MVETTRRRKHGVGDRRQGAAAQAQVRHRHGYRHAQRQAGGEGRRPASWSSSAMAWMRRNNNWNDYAGMTVKGKTVVMFVNDPGFHGNDEIAVRWQAHDLLRALDLQVRRGRAQGRGRGADHPRRCRVRVLRLGRGQEFLVRRAIRPAGQRTTRPRACRRRAGSPPSWPISCSPMPGWTWTSCAAGCQQARLQSGVAEGEDVRGPEEHERREESRATWSGSCPVPARSPMKR